MRFLRALLLAAGMLFLPVASFAQVSVAITIAPPELPVYAQPICPGDGYIWTPGYWAYGPDGYYWVPGTWVEPPQVGFLWTPGYWGWGGAAFIFHEGYWGPHVGFYGGINYGYGYVGRGYEGGRWDGGHFYYNRAVNNVNVTVVHNVYRRESPKRTSRVSATTAATVESKSVPRERKKPIRTNGTILLAKFKRSTWRQHERTQSLERRQITASRRLLLPRNQARFTKRRLLRRVTTTNPQDQKRARRTRTQLFIPRNCRLPNAQKLLTPGMQRPTRSISSNKPS